MGIKQLLIAGTEVTLESRIVLGKVEYYLPEPVQISDGIGELTVVGYNSETGEISCSYVPAILDHSENSPYNVYEQGSDRIITDTYTVQLTDLEGQTVTDSFVLAIADTVPVANDDAVVLYENSTGMIIDIAKNDIKSADDVSPGNSDTVDNTWTIKDDPSNGSLTAHDDGTYTYVPNPGFNGQDSFTYTITDGDGSEDTATVYITVHPLVKSVSEAEAVEGSNLVHTVILSGTTTSLATYGFLLENGTAEVNVDYMASPVFSNGVTYDSLYGLIRVPAGVSTFTVSYRTLVDTLIEGDETTQLTVDGVLGTGVIKDYNPSMPIATDNVAADGSALVPPNLEVISSNSFTNDNTPTFSGNAGIEKAGGTVNIYDGTALIGTALVDGEGSWDFTPELDEPLSDGLHSITTTVTDKDGQASSVSEALVFTVDTSAPAKPEFTAWDDVAADGLTELSPPEAIVDNGVTNDKTPTFSGNAGAAEAGGTVTVYDGTTVIGTAVIDRNGNWSLTTETALNDGSHSITVTLTDQAGQVSEPSDALNFTVDTSAPLRPTFTATDNVGTTTGVITAGSTTDDATPTFTGNAGASEAGSIAKIYDGAALIGTAIVGTDGNWTYTPATSLSEGPHSITVTLTDKAGQVSEPSETLDFTVDAVAPTNGWTITANTDRVVEGESISVTIAYDGPVVPGQSVSVKLTNDNVNTGDYDWSAFLDAVKVAADGSDGIDPRTDLKFDRGTATLTYTAPNYSIYTTESLAANSSASDSVYSLIKTDEKWQNLDDEWIDLTGIGYKSPRPEAAGYHTPPIYLGINFIFFGQEYSYISVNEDGTIQLFKNSSEIYVNSYGNYYGNAVDGGMIYPDNWKIKDIPGAVIAYSLGDFHLSNSANVGNIDYATLGDKFILQVEMQNAASLSKNNTGFIQIALDQSSGNITFHYQDTEYDFSRVDNGKNTQVGIKSPDGTVIAYSDGQEWIKTGTTVVFEGPQPTMPALIVSLNTINDTEVEGAEQFSVSLSNPTNSTVTTGRGSITTTIFDNEAPGLLANDDNGTNILNNGTTNDNTPTFSGVGVSGDRITLMDGSNQLGTTFVDTDGNWTYTPTSPLAAC